MADDSMEISSEHGHNDGDGDIDIDFDFSTAQADEDFVLEDAASTADFGEGLGHQPSPAIGNDDVMVDEDVDIYPMDDADLLHGEDGHNMEHEVLPFAAEDPLHLGEDGTHGIQFEAHDSNDASGYVYAHQISSDAQAAENGASEGISGDGAQQGDLQTTEVIAVTDVEQSSTAVAQHDSRTASPFQGSPKSAISVQGPRSPPAPNPEGGPISPDHISQHPETNITSPSLSGHCSKAVESTSLATTTLRHSPQDVMVVYQSIKYALFSSSELDDPDSFFLSDLSIAEKPLSDLFMAVRQVIQEDLSDEDELCMAVEDLGIETEEQSSTLLHDVTLTQILNLREKLLQNDGVESPHPLCIILGTRTNFSKRLENLTAGAAEGKGLSQFIIWDEHSESLDDLEEGSESKSGVEPTLESQEQQIVSGVEEEANAEQAALGIENRAQEEPAQEYEYDYEHEHEHLEEPEPEPEFIEEAKLPSVESTSGHGSIQQSTATDVNSSILQVAKENGSPSNENFDEDDLIDYSEEEGDNEPGVQKHTKSHSSDENRTNQEYEAINEDLRRRFMSRTTEDKVPEKTNEQAPHTAEDSHEGAYENGIEYEEKNDYQDDFQNGGLSAGFEDFTTGEFDATGSLEQFDGTGLSAEFGGEGEFTDEGVIDDSFDVFGTEGQEYTYGDEGAFGDDFDSHGVQEDQSGAEKSRPGAEVTEEHLEQADTAESSVTVDADEIQYEDEANDESLDNSKNNAQSHEKGHPVGVEHEDEIDYEDDDEVDKKNPGATTPVTAASALPSSNGKRSRAIVESDDAIDMRSKEAKRPRP